MLLFAFAVVVFPISPASIENFLVFEGIKNYSVIPNTWYNSSFFVSLKLINTSLAQPLNVNVSFSADQKDAKVVFPKGNWVILSCFPVNNSCISQKKEVKFMFMSKNSTSFQLKLYATAKLINQSISEIEGISTSQIFSTFSSIIEEIKNFVLSDKNKELLFFIFIFLLGIFLGFLLSKRKKKIKPKPFGNVTSQ
jgi:hypothetical protein